MSFQNLDLRSNLFFLFFCFVQNYNFSQSDGAASATVIVVVAATAAVAATIIVVVVAIACCCCVQILAVVLLEQKLETPAKPVFRETFLNEEKSELFARL